MNQRFGLRGEEDGLNMFIVIEHLHPREDRSFLEGGEMLFEQSRDIRDGQGNSRGGGIAEECDVPHRSVVACGAYRG